MAIYELEPNLPQQDPVFFDPRDILHATSRSNPELVQKSITTQESVYRAEGYISENDSLFDEFTDSSTYFFGESDDLAVTARLISGKKVGLANLPTFKEFAIDTDLLCSSTGIERLSDIKDSNIVEVSALASLNGSTDLTFAQKKQTTLALYASMLRYSLEEGHNLWVMATDRRVTRGLRSLMGDSLKKFGESKHYMGSETEPVFTTPEEVIKHILTNSKNEVAVETLKEALQGVKMSKKNEELSELLAENSIETTTSLVNEIKKRPTATAAAGLAGYAALRAAPLAGIEGFSGNPALFAAIDIGTVPPYVKGLEALYAARNSAREKIGGFVLATGSFIAPYAYLYANGENLPPIVHGAVALMAGTGAGKAVLDYKKDRARRKDIENIKTV